MLHTQLISSKKVRRSFRVVILCQFREEIFWDSPGPCQRPQGCRRCIGCCQRRCIWSAVEGVACPFEGVPQFSIIRLHLAARLGAAVPYLLHGLTSVLWLSSIFFCLPYPYSITFILLIPSRLYFAWFGLHLCGMVGLGSHPACCILFSARSLCELYGS